LLLTAWRTGFAACARSRMSLPERDFQPQKV